MNNSDSVFSTDFIMVDDDQLLLHMVARRLRGVDYTAKLFHDEMLAREYLLFNSTNVLVVDYNLPRFTGLEMIEELIASNPRVAKSIYLSSSIEVPEAAHYKAKELGVKTIAKDMYSNFNRLIEMLELGPDSGLGGRLDCYVLLAR